MKIRTVSLFNGMNCGKMALDIEGIDSEYYYSEIDKPLFDAASGVGIFFTVTLGSVGIVLLSQDYTEQHSKTIIEPALKIETSINGDEIISDTTYIYKFENPNK